MWSEAEEMQEREVTVLWERDQRRMETQKAPPGRMTVGGR